MLEGFFQIVTHTELIAPSFETYYEVIELIVEKMDREYAEAFCTMLSPATLAREEDVLAFKRCLPQKQNDSFLSTFVQKQLDIIENIRRGREIYENYKSEDARSQKCHITASDN